MGREKKPAGTILSHGHTHKHTHTHTHTPPPEGSNQPPASVGESTTWQERNTSKNANSPVMPTGYEGGKQNDQRPRLHYKIIKRTFCSKCRQAGRQAGRQAHSGPQNVRVVHH